MKFTSASARKAPMILYHAVSSYQLLEAMLHRMLYHETARAVLLLPDFITRKYPQYQKLAAKHFFDEVYLFPYLHIPHREEKKILEDVSQCYRQRVPHDISEFSDFFIAGAHFYFSLYLIEHRLPFVFWEDAAGMLSRSKELYEALRVNFPIHAEIAQKHGLFDGSNPLVRRIVCLKKAQTKDVSGEKYEDFSVERALQALPPGKRKKVCRFFLKRRLHTKAEGILLTQHFSNLGMMSEEDQKKLYEGLRDGVLRGKRILIKRHPDDTLDYSKIFPQAEIIRQTFPSELLPYVFRKPPNTIYTFDSTGCENLGEQFHILKIRRQS